MPMSEAKKRANKKWNDANVKDLYDRINFVVKKGQRDIIKEHAASSINLACLIWCSSNDYWDVYYYMQESIKTAFDKNGISIPYNQLDVHITKE